jgi:KDO2-lipid IV(A) lauroyltransferase
LSDPSDTAPPLPSDSPRTSRAAAAPRPPKDEAGVGHRLRTTAWQRFVLSLMTGATTPLRALSRPAALRFGTILGSLGYYLALRSRRQAVSNLRLAYRDELTAAQRESLTKRVFQHFGRCVVDFLRAPTLGPEQLSALVTCEGWEHVEAARKAGRGVILVMAHLGNWELLGRWVARVQDVPLTVVARDPRSPALTEYMRAMREGAGFAVFSKGSSAGGMLRALRRGEAIGLLPDQNSGDVFAPFFGVPAGTPAGPASLALHTGAVLIPVYCVYDPASPEHAFKVLCLPPVDATPTGAKDADVARIMAELNLALEGVIRQYPDQWLWLHNRWKSAFEEKNRERAWPDGKPDALRL